MFSGSSPTKSPQKLLSNIVNTTTTAQPSVKNLVRTMQDKTGDRVATEGTLNDKPMDAVTPTENAPQAPPVVNLESENEPETTEVGVPFEQQKQMMDRTLLQKLLEKTHHSGSAFSFQTMVDQLSDVLSQLHPEERVKFKHDGKMVEGQVISCEKKGAMKFYYVKINGVKLQDRLPSSSLKRPFQPSEDDLRVFLESVSTKNPGKPWEVHEDLRKEFGVENKLAALFCTTPKAKKNIPLLTGRSLENSNESSSEDDTPLEAFRRSGAGLPPSATQKHIQKKQKEIVKKEKKQKAEGETKPKVPKPKKEKSVKKEKPPAAAASLSMFVTTPSKEGDGSPSKAVGSPFMSPGRAEKRFMTATNKLNDAWQKRDLKDFQTAAAWAAKALSGIQVDKLGHELHRFAVKKIVDKEKDKNAMKKMATSQARKEFRAKMADERRVYYARMDRRIKSYFNEVIIVEDLTVVKDDLPCPGHPLALKPDLTGYFPDCLMITQFLSALKKYVDCDEHVSAVDLLNGLADGNIGFMKSTSKVLVSLVRTLLQDEEYKKYAHCNARLHEFMVEETSVSELCRALLGGSTDVNPKSDEKKDSTQNGAEGGARDEEDRETEDGRQTPDDQMDVSQMEQDECNSLLSRFTADKEFWQLSVDDQISLMRMLLFRILDLYSFTDYIRNDSMSSEAETLKKRVDKQTEQLDKWREHIAEMPQFGENEDISQLSRTQSRERAEILRKKADLEGKIEDGENKVEDLLEKMAVEKRIQALSKRIKPIGQDRHFRSYYWFPHDGPDGGLWVQDFGVTPYEKFVRSCIAAGKSYLESAEGEESFVENEKPKERWLRITNIEAMKTFVKSLCKFGSREGSLKSFLVKNMDEAIQGVALGSKENSVCSAKPETEDGKEEEKEENEEEKMEGEDEEEPEEEEKDEISADPLDLLKSRIITLANDLRKNYMTSIDVATFDAKLVSTSDLNVVKSCLCELVDSMQPNAIIQKMSMKEAHESGSYSWLILDRWKARLSEAQNPSAVHLLRSYLDSRIDWKQSVLDKRCRRCNSRRSPDSKIACDGCGMVLHYYCTPAPKLREKPNSWTCSACVRVKRKQEVDERRAKKEWQKKGGESEDDESEGEDAEEESGDEDDYYSAKNQKRAATRKRVVVDSDFEDDVEEEEGEPSKRGRAKRAKIGSHKEKESDVAVECLAIFDKLKASQRIYRTLQALPEQRVSRSRRGGASMTLSAIEEKLYDYPSVEKFTQDLNAYLQAALKYFEEHNERKVSELEEVMSVLDLAN